MTTIKEALLEANPWWKGEFEVPFKERVLYGQLRKFMPYRQMIALTGMRRVGKTTLMLKLAEQSISEGLSPLKVVYFSFDEFRSVEIRQVLQEYERLTESDMRQGKSLVLLDELQKVGNWEDQLKSIYDSIGKNAKFLVSGSESLFIRRKSRETLAGRLFEFKVEPLTFVEFLWFKGAAIEPLGMHEKELSRLFWEYVKTMGFPELVGVREKEVVRKYVNESIVGKVVYRDVAELFRVKDVSVVASLLAVFMEEPGQLIDFRDLAGDFNISRQTLSDYLTYLEDSFLLRKLYNFSRNKRKSEQKLKKYYPTLISPNLAFSEDDFSKSRVFEWALVTQLKANFFWRDSYKNEVDVVMADKAIQPIEIKYGKISFDGLLAFMKKFKVSRGYIVSADKEGKHEIEGKRIDIVPAFKFLLREKRS